jgi:hypothetical protein
MKKYKMIKNYPDSGFEVGDYAVCNGEYYRNEKKIYWKEGDLGKFSEFWEEVKEPLFTTLDGFPIFEGETFYSVSKYNDEYMIYQVFAKKGGHFYMKSLSSPKFTNHESAKKFIDNQKIGLEKHGRNFAEPKFSINDINRAINVCKDIPYPNFIDLEHFRFVLHI